DGLVWAYKEAPADLHGAGGAALLMAALSQVNPGCLKQAEVIDPAMLKEARVLNGQHRLNHRLGDVIVLHQLTLGALLRIKERRHKLRFQFVGGQVGDTGSGTWVNRPI